ncbi:hypothetical protein VTI74DRAFT_7309 [Chaetomium olivicolor]
MLWTTYVERVEPLWKILYIPSTARVVEAISQEPAKASKADECLLFAVYHSATVSMTEEECIAKFRVSRAALLQHYYFAARQALVNAAFLKTTEIAVMQALVLFLLSSQYSYGAHTYWILTGVAPGIAERPQEQKGATEMLLYLSRICLGNFFAARAKLAEGRGSNPWLYGDIREAEKLVADAESQVEERYIRYCDVVNPLHFLAVCLARSGITAMRLRIRLPKARGETASAADIREDFQLGQKILDTDDSFIFILTALSKNKETCSAAEIDAVWAKIGQMYHHHDELLESNRPLYVALARLALRV